MHANVSFNNPGYIGSILAQLAHIITITERIRNSTSSTNYEPLYPTSLGVSPFAMCLLVVVVVVLLTHRDLGNSGVAGGKHGDFPQEQLRLRPLTHGVYGADELEANQGEIPCPHSVIADDARARGRGDNLSRACINRKRSLG